MEPLTLRFESFLYAGGVTDTVLKCPGRVMGPLSCSRLGLILDLLDTFALLNSGFRDESTLIPVTLNQRSS